MIYVLLGATGSGKSELSLPLARALNAEIVNADAYQVYKDFPIATATPSPKERKGVPHHLFSFLESNEPYDVCQYQKDARETLEKIKKAGKTPLFVGGSGLYIRSALYDYDFSVDTSKVDLSPYEGLDGLSLHAELTKLDPEEAKKLPYQNRRRVLRSLSLCLALGESKTSYLARQNHEPIEPTTFLYLIRDREELLSRIERRVERMFEVGLVEEVLPKIQNITERKGAYQAIGVKEFFPYRDGLMGLEEVKEAIVLDTRRYAKRQETFFRHQFKTIPVHNLEEALNAIHR